MLPPSVRAAFDALAEYLSYSDDNTSELREHWRVGSFAPSPLSPAAREAAATLDRLLPALTRSSGSAGELGALFRGPAAEALMVWCVANASRSDLRLAPLLSHAIAVFGDRAVHAARDRVLEGPLTDALAALPLLGNGAALAAPENAQCRARMEILFWEAGASALQLPELGPWLWGSADAFESVVAQSARGTLRGRVFAARCLEVCATGLPNASPEHVGRSMQVLQPLLLHPEPLVWVHAARALGRFASVVDALEGTLLDWIRSESPLLRQRAITAFSAQSAARLTVYGGELAAIIDAPDQQPWVLAAVAASTPYLFVERRDLWERLAARITAGDGGAIAARGLARGLNALWRRNVTQARVELPMRQLRDMARHIRYDSLDDARRWLEVTAATDLVDRAERDPLDIELGLENLIRLAAQYDDEEADARAARFAEGLSLTFQEARKVLLGARTLRRRASGHNALEGAARALAVRLWAPLLATCPTGSPLPEPDMEPAWQLVAEAPEELLRAVAERRKSGTDEDLAIALDLEVLAVRLGGYALDACGEEPDLGPGRGPAAHRTCLWLRKLDGLADGARELETPLRTALSALLWRLVDTTRGSALGEVDDARWLGPFAAWWALVIDRPAMLLQLAAALPMIAPGALERGCALADALRAALTTDLARASEGAWHAEAERLMRELHAEDTELSVALLDLAQSLARFTTASGPRPDLDAQCFGLVHAAERLREALADPVRALHAMSDATATHMDDVERVASTLERAIRARDITSAGVWFGSLGPVASALVESAVTAAVRRTPPAPPVARAKSPEVVAGYELVKPLGEGGMGSVWLVRKPGADRLFVLKIPKEDALAGANEAEKAGILESFVDEARALAGLYHPNVANIIDRGVRDEVPFLLLEYLIGADLKHYAAARTMSPFELRQVVVDACAGLAALHGAGLVHRDVKPANLWLRLPLAGGERFDPERHRDPARTSPLSTVVIDFGMVRAMRVSPEIAGRFAAGTPGYIAPEQVLDPVELDGRTDVYSLAGAIYNVMSGRAFFDDISSTRDRILAHMKRPPLEDPARVAGMPASIVGLLRHATALDLNDRPSMLDFGREFARLV